MLQYFESFFPVIVRKRLNISFRSIESKAINILRLIIDPKNFVD